jgi:hypothetical protein
VRRLSLTQAFRYCWKSATLGAGSVQLGGYLLVKQRREFVDGIRFLSSRLFSLDLAVIPRIFFWTRVEYVEYL